MQLFARTANQFNRSTSQEDYKWNAIAQPIWQGSAADIKQGVPFELAFPLLANAIAG
jgi:hypothetical protein